MSTKIIKIKKKKVEPNIKNNIKNNFLNKKLNLEEDISISYKPINEISNKISNFINKNDEMIEPLSWVLPNKKNLLIGFLNFRLTRDLNHLNIKNY